jgi:hypothetical protein
MGDLWRQGRTGCVEWQAPLQFLEKAPAVVKEELEWAKNNGACGIFMRGLECEQALGAPYFHRLWQISGDLDLPVCVHSANGSFVHHDFFNEDTTFTKFKLAVVGACHTFSKRDPEKVSERPLGLRRSRRAMGTLYSERSADRFQAQGQVASGERASRQ